MRQVVGARASASGGTWGTAEEVPGSAQLNEGGSAIINSVSCGSVGNCSAGGSYADASDNAQALVVNETNGTWRNAKEVPGTAALNEGGDSQVNSVSCASAGNCSAAGSYRNGSSQYQAFVVNETHGTWRNAKEVPGTAALNSGGNAQADRVSCGSPGNCSAGGFYTDASGHEQVFLVTETNGTWHTAKKVRRLGALNQGGQGQLYSVSCKSAGNCTAGGFYTAASGDSQPFVVSEVNGTWGTAEELPGITALDRGGFGDIEVLSCGSAGNCSAGGGYTDAAGNYGLFVDNQTNGTWGTPEEVPGFPAASQGQYLAMACASPGNCTAGGLYTPASAYEAFVVDETNGTWHAIEEVPGTAALNSGGYASVYSISCASAGNCSAGGSYYTDSPNIQAFVVNETHGTWRNAKEVPGTAALNQGGHAAIEAVSCAAAGHCSAGGYYTDSSNLNQVFVVNET
jgi:uncharacterized protein CbrC (UPF0167 family)